MRRSFRYCGSVAFGALVIGLLTGGLAGLHPSPAAAQVELRYQVSFGYFQDRLSAYGAWGYDDRWGDVWRPAQGRHFRPYYEGYWAYTDDYGWMWVSDEPWADITYHYGRWVYDPEEGWLWIPGYVWAPAWVIWREGGDYLGWFPMPPDYGDFDDGPYYGGHYGWDDCYGYRTWYRMDQDRFFSLWIFVDHEHFARRDYRSFAIERERVRDVIRRTSDSTRYAMSGDRIVNRSVPNDRIERAMHHRIEAVPAHRFLRGNVPMVPSSAGRDIARREHEGGRQHGDEGSRRERHDDGGAGPFKGPPSHDRGQGDGDRSGKGDRSRHWENAAPPLPPAPSAQPPDTGPKHERHEQHGDGEHNPPPQRFERAPPMREMHEHTQGGPSHEGGGQPNGQPHGNSHQDHDHGDGKPDHDKGQQN